MNVHGARPLPGWLVALGSLGIGFHVLALVVLALSAPSGPWPTRFGTSTALAPTFASTISEVTTLHYLQHLAMTHNYHFDSNRSDLPAVKFEAHLYDEAGDLKEILHFPDPKANFWVRQRQGILAQDLGGDEPYQAPQGEVIPAPGKSLDVINFFYSPTQKVERYELYQADQNQVPKEQVFRPSDWSLLLVRSYGRHVKRQTGAARVEIVRQSRDPLMPALMFRDPMTPEKLLVDQPPPRTFDTLVCSFGDGQPKRWRVK